MDLAVVFLAAALPSRTPARSRSAGSDECHSVSSVERVPMACVAEGLSAALDRSVLLLSLARSTHLAAGQSRLGQTSASGAGPPQCALGRGDETHGTHTT